MPNYQESKVYKLTCSDTNKIYIGSTVQSLQIRLNSHKGKGNTCVSKTLVNPTIELLHLTPCNSKKELLMIEQKYINEYECINDRTSYTSHADKLKQRKARRDAMPFEQRKERARKYYLKSVTNPETIEKNRERSIKKVECECGTIVMAGNMTRHKKSKLHIANLDK